MAKEFLCEVESLYEKILASVEVRPLSQADLESLDLAPLATAQKVIDQAGIELLEKLSLPDRLVLIHRLDILLNALSPFGREDGPIALRLAALSGQGPEGAYRKASSESAALFGQKNLGKL
ncbi:MAG: hypothetical protein M0Z25_09715 [Nitrospiraceae bacterium]|nr:hypothetical protein [Nitrospiraceae bacterium]